MPILKCYIMKSEREGREFELRRKGGRNEERVDGRDQGWLDAGHGEWTSKGKERREDGKNNL